MYLVGFNGPPRSGKDTMARMLADHMDSQGVTIPVIEVSLSTPLRRIAYEMTHQLGKHLDGDDYETFKSTHFPAFNKDGRQIMIDISERFLKQCYGQEIMAKLLLQELADFNGLALIRDSGFQIEVTTLAKAVGIDNLYIVNVRRKGCDFSNDSRQWVGHEHLMLCDNYGTLDDLRTEAGRLYGRLVNQMGWKL